MRDLIGNIAGAPARAASGALSAVLPSRLEPLELDGAVALVTGGAAGIGLAVGELLAGRGSRVALVDIDGAAAEDAASGLGGGAIGIGADVTDLEAMRAAATETVERFGRLDVVVANAGITPAPATLRTLDPADYHRVIAVNQTGVFNTIKAGIEPVIEAGGHIAVIASMAATMPGPGGAPYMVSKAAAEQLGRTLRLELAPHGASAGVVYLGIVETAMTHGTLDSDPIGPRLEAKLPAPLRRRISAEQAAAAICAGIESRAGETIEPAAWRPVAGLRGVLGVAFDRLAADPEVADLVGELERR